MTRTAAKLAGSMSPRPSASRHSRELAANASIDATVSAIATIALPGML
jgi:hypothetical protein